MQFFIHSTYQKTAAAGRSYSLFSNSKLTGIDLCLAFGVAHNQELVSNLNGGYAQSHKQGQPAAGQKFLGIISI